jgi:hypothetical protein
MEDTMSVMNSNTHADRAKAVAGFRAGLASPIGVTCSWISDFEFDSASCAALQHEVQRDAEEGLSEEVGTKT